MPFLLIYLNYISFLYIYHIVLIPFLSTHHRIEEFLALMPLVLSLPAPFAVELDFPSVTHMAPEYLLLYTASREQLQCADTPLHSVSYPWVFLSREP